MGNIYESLEELPVAKEIVETGDKKVPWKIERHKTPVASPVVVHEGRYMVRMDLGNGISQPFYLSSGQNPKKGVAKGKWYPVFGIDDNEFGGWIKKTDDVGSYYNNPVLKSAAERLDSELGNLQDPKIRGTIEEQLGRKIPRPSVTNHPEFLDAINRGQPEITYEPRPDGVSRRKLVRDYLNTIPENPQQTLAAGLQQARAAGKPDVKMPDNPTQPWTPPKPPPPPNSSSVASRGAEIPIGASRAARAANWGENLTGGPFTRGGAIGTAGIALGMGTYKSFSEQMDEYKRQNPVFRENDSWMPDARDMRAFGHAATQGETYANIPKYFTEDIQGTFGNPADALARGDTFVQRTFGSEQVADNPVLAGAAIIESTGVGLGRNAKQLVTEDIPWLATEGLPAFANWAGDKASSAYQSYNNWASKQGERIGDAMFSNRNRTVEIEKEREQAVKDVDDTANSLF